MAAKPPIPKEHGSWAMLIVPLVVGLSVAPGWHWRSPVLWVAALAFFLLRYPLAMLVKTRRRAASSQRVELWRWAAIYGGLAGLCGGWLVLANGLWWLVPMSLLGALLVVLHLWLVARRQEMSVTGELSAIIGLAMGAPMAYYVAGGQLDAIALLLWLINGLYFGGTVFYIKLKVRQQPRSPAPDKISERLLKARACLTYQTFALTLVILLVAWQKAPLLSLLAFLPATVKIGYGALHWQDKKSLSLVRLGVTEIFHSVAFAVLIIVAFR